MTIRVIEDQLPTAMARADIMCGVVPLTVNFNGSGSFDPEGHPLQYVWKFGDSSEFSFDESPSHIFRRTGDFDVTLQVVDERGLVDVDALRITELATAPAVPALPRSGPWLLGLLLSLAGPAQLARRVEAK